MQTAATPPPLLPPTPYVVRISKTIELCFSPDVPNPGGGEPGGIRLRVPERTTSAPSPGVFVSELDDEPPAKPNGPQLRRRDD